jgi:hypothetical protein
MKRVDLIILASALTAFISCGVSKPTLPLATDTTIVNIVDSIAWHDSTVFHHVYKEIYNDYANLLDTLNISTSYSDFSAWVDTTQNVLKGKAENKDIDIPVKTKWKEKIVYKDSIQIKEVPYPVEVIKEVTKYPSTYWWFMGFTVLTLIYFGRKLYLKFKI